VIAIYQAHPAILSKKPASQDYSRCGPPSLKYKEVQMSRSTGMYESDPLRRSSSLCSLVEPEVLILVRQKKTRLAAGFL
jgi:hypothetical protein